MAGLMGKLGVEVPLSRLERAKIPAVYVPALGEPVLELSPVVSTAGRPRYMPLSPAVRHTLWTLDAAAPQELLVAEFGFAVPWEETAARVCFAAPLLPSVGIVPVPEASQLAAVTADGALHVLRVPMRLQRDRAAGRRASMAGALGEEGAVRSVALAPHFARAGTPTSLLLLEGFVCIGTDQGAVVCVPSDTLDEAAAFELRPGGGGLSKMFGGLFGKPAGQSVAQLAQMNYLNKNFLCAVHEEGQLRLWDLAHRRLVYSADLLPPSAAAALLPTHVALAAEPLDACTSILLVYYRQREGEGAGELRAYEIFVEQRGESTYKVDLESGPQLPGSIHRLHSLVLENISLHTVGAWMLYDDEAGQRRVVCVPLAFNQRTVTAATVVHLIEDQLRDGSCEEDTAPIHQALWQSVEASLRAAGAAPPADALPGAFLDALLAPGRISRPALHAALRALGGGRAGGASLEELQQCDVEELRRLLPGWVAAAAAGGAWQGTPVGAWGALLRHYAAAWAREHTAVALIQSGAVETGGLMLIREGGWVTFIRRGTPPELGLQAELSPGYIDNTGSGDCETVINVLNTSNILMRALGGHVLGRLAWTCLRGGLDLRGAILPAFCEALATGGGGLGPQGAQAGARAQWGEWRAHCRLLPLELGRALDRGGGPLDGFAYAFGQALEMLDAEYLPGVLRSDLPALTQQMAGPLAASAAQICAARLQCLFQLSLLASYVCASQTLGAWSLPAQDAQELTARLLPKAERMLLAAVVGYWACVTPLPLPADPASLDPSQLVISLRIGENGPGSNAPKRARLSAAPDSFVVDLLLKQPWASAEHLHVMREVADVHSVALRLGELLTAVVPVKGRHLAGEVATPCGDPTQLALQVALDLFQGGSAHSAHLASLLALLPDTSDARLTFLKACSIARCIPGSAAAPRQRQQRMEESAALFFRAAAIFNAPEQHKEEVKVVNKCMRQLQQEMAGSYKKEGLQALELQYYETIMMLYERLGLPEAASKFALAATKQVHVALPGADQSYARLQREGRLWANVFAHALEDGKYEEAYAAMLSNTVTDVQLDCMQRLVHSLCNAGRVQLLCALPFAANMLVNREGREEWVTLLDEVVGCLQRRAESLGLDATPQPYKVLYAFHASRGNWQSAAAAMLALSRRLVGEGAGDAEALNQAELALGAAVSALSLVEASQAWLEDPAGPRQDAADRPLFPQLWASKNAEGGDGVPPPPAILTLEQLQREHAVARAHAAVAAAMPGGEATSAQPDNVFSQLLALGLHEAAVSLAEAIYSGTRLTRALEQAFASQAVHCTRLQLQSSTAGSSGGGRMGTGGTVASPLGAHAGLGFAEPGDGMEEDAGFGDGGMDAGAPGDGLAAEGEGRDGAGWQDGRLPNAGAAAAAWRKLKHQLARFEGGEHGNRLRLLIVESALATERQLGLPPWLLAPFKAGTGDVAGLVRVLMRFGRLEEAGQLAARHLGLSLQSVPSISMQRMAQQCYSHGLLQELLARLEMEASAGDEGAQRCHAQLAKAVQAEAEAAARQTTVIGQLYV